MSRSATLGHVRDALARKHFLMFDRFILSRVERTSKAQKVKGLPSATLRTRLGRLRKGDLTGLYAHSGYLSGVRIIFPAGGRLPPTVEFDRADGRHFLRMPSISCFCRVFDLRQQVSARAAVPLCAFRFMHNNAVLDDESELTTLYMFEGIVLILEWLVPPVARVYFEELDGKRHVLDVKCDPRVTYRSAVASFRDDVPFLEYKNDPLLNSEVIGERAIDPRFPIILRPRKLSVQVTSRRGQHSITLTRTFTAGAICKSLQRLFTDGDILTLFYHDTPLKPTDVVVDVNPDLEPLELKDAPPLKQFTFRDRTGVFTLSSPTRVLSALMPDLRRRFTKGFIVQLHGARIDDTAQLDPEVVYDIVPLATPLAVRLEAVGAPPSAPLRERVLTLTDPTHLNFATLFKKLELRNVKNLRVYAGSTKQKDPINLGDLGKDPTLVIRYPAPCCPCSYSFTGPLFTSPFLFEIAAPERVGVTKIGVLAACKRPEIIPAAIDFSFWGVVFDDDRDILSYAVPAGCSISVTQVNPLTIDVVLDGQTTQYIGDQRSTAAQLAAVIASAQKVSSESVELESGGVILAPAAVIGALDVPTVRAILQTDFTFTTLQGAIHLRLPSTATVDDARRAVSDHFAITDDRIDFAKDGVPLTDFSQRLVDVGSIDLSIRYPIVIRFKGRSYTLTAEYSTAVSQLKRMVSDAIGGSIPPDRLNILENRAILDDELTLEDIEYSPESPPLIAEEEKEWEPAPLPALPAVYQPMLVVPPPSPPPAVSAPPATATYVIRLEIGAVRRFGSFQFAPSTPLGEVLPELQRRWALGDLAVEFVLLDENRRFTAVAMTELIGSIDHMQFSLILREAVGSFAHLADDPEPTGPETTRLLFKIEQRANAEVRLTFATQAVIGDVRERIAGKLGVEAQAISLQSGGKPLRDRFIIGRLRSDQAIIVYILNAT
jgi:hypothetical protein